MALGKLKGGGEDKIRILCVQLRVAGPGRSPQLYKFVRSQRVSDKLSIRRPQASQDATKLRSKSDEFTLFIRPIFGCWESSDPSCRLTSRYTLKSNHFGCYYLSHCLSSLLLFPLGLPLLVGDSVYSLFFLLILAFARACRCPAVVYCGFWMICRFPGT